MDNQEIPGCRLLSEEALRRGFRLKNGKANNRGFTDFLKQIGVVIRGTRKRRLVCPADIDAAWSRLPVVSAPSSGSDDDLVASLIERGR